MESETVKTKRRKPSATPVIVIISLVLFMLGVLAISIIGFKGFSQSVIEGSSMDVYFKDSISENSILTFVKTIEKQSWCKKTKFISREQGLKEMELSADKDMMEFVQIADIPLSVEVFVKAELGQEPNYASVEDWLMQNPDIDDIVYQRNLMKKVSKNLHKAQWILAGVAFIMVLIALALINNATRLSIFANRFTIKSMQLVGATNAFIMKPFIKKFAIYTLIAIPIALGILVGVILGLHFFWSDFGRIEEIWRYIKWEHAIMAVTFVCLIGIFIVMICAWLATNRYLRSKIENLY